MNSSPSSLLEENPRELPLVDREEELALLLGMLERMTKSDGQVVFVAGEGGIGKTRLVIELGRQAVKKGVFFAGGRAYEDESLIPYSPWIEVVRSIHEASPTAFKKLPRHILAEVERLVPGLALGSKELGIQRWIAGPKIGDLAYRSADIETVRLFQAVTELFFLASEEKPLLLFLDDVLWADEASLQLLHYVCRRIEKKRIMVVAAYRDVELAEGHPISRLIQNMKREKTIQQISIRRLGPANVSDIISNYYGGGAVVLKFAKIVHQKTGGNPLFVEEVLRSLSEEERVYNSRHGWVLKEDSVMTIPSTVRAIEKRRISRLPNEVVQILSAASVIGMEFEYELLRRIAGPDEDGTISGLEQAMKTGLISEKHEGSEVLYIFSDEQVKDVLYDGLSFIRRTRFHTQVAQVLEELSMQDTSSRVEAIAYHYLLSGGREKAAKFSLMAGDRARTLYAHPEARKHYSNVLSLLGEEDRDLRLEVLVKIGDSSYRMGDPEACSRSYIDAAALAAFLKQKRVLASIYSKLGEAQWFLSTDKQGALQSFKEGLRVLEGEADAPEKAALCQNIARLLASSGEGEASRPWSEEAVRISRKLEDHEVLAHSLVSLAWGIKPAHKNKADIFRYLEEALAISTEHGLDVSGCRTYLNLGQAYARLDHDYVKAKDTLIKGLEYCKRTGYLHYQGHLRMLLAEFAYIPLGMWDKACEISEERLGIEFGFADHVLMCGLLAIQALCDLFKGNTRSPEEKINKALRLAEKSQWLLFIYVWSLKFGKLCLRKNDLAGAERYLLRAVEDAKLMTWDYPPLEAYLELIRLYSMKADFKNSEAMLERIRSSKEEVDAKWVSAYEHWACGLLASAKGEWDTAKEALTKSGELWSQLNHPYDYALTTLELGKTMERTGDLKGARECLDQARTIFAGLGAKLDPAHVRIGIR